MMLAYRRGLLKPDYPHGLQSRLREDMILRMLNSELAAESFIESAHLVGEVVGPHVNPKRLGELERELQKRITHASKLYEYEDAVYHSVEEENEEFTKQATRWYMAYKAEHGDDQSGQDV